LLGEPLDQVLRDVAAKARSRTALWVDVVNRAGIAAFAEIGVWRGGFTERLLGNCPSIERYYMVDPWRHLEDWNKPSNLSDAEFPKIFDEAMARTAFAADKRVVLRANTRDAMREIAGGSLDAAYIDGDHTLRGIAIDLIAVYDKVKPGGFILGDDFSPTIWQHAAEFEPTLVFPFAVHFAEAKDDAIFALPFNQFLIAKTDTPGRFGFHDLTGNYPETGLRRQFPPPPKRRG
jgi:hypothetical protein